MTTPSEAAPDASLSPPIRVLIADDHAVILEGLGAMLGRQADMRVVAHAANGREAVELWKKYRPDVTLLDLRMPELDGVGAIQELRHLDPTARVIVLTTYDTDEHIYKAIKAGAKAYLTEGCQARRLAGVHSPRSCGRNLRSGQHRRQAGRSRGP